MKLDPFVDHRQSCELLRKIPGVGEWTAQYIALRAMHWPDAFPAADLGLLRAAGLESPKALERASESWKPWRSYAAVHLWSSP